MICSVKPFFFQLLVMNTVFILLKDILRALCIDNLSYKLEKEQGLPQICNVYVATSVVSSFWVGKGA